MKLRHDRVIAGSQLSNSKMGAEKLLILEAERATSSLFHHRNRPEFKPGYMYTISITLTERRVEIPD